MAATCAGTSSRTASASSSLAVTSTAPASGSCSAWLIRSAATCAGSAVSSARIADLGGPGLGVDADQPAQQPLGRGHVDVARPGHHVDRLAGAGAVAEDGDRLRPADGVDLGDAQQRARRQHAGVGQAAVVALRRGRHRDRLHAGDLRRDDVHDHAGQQRGQSAGHVEADPADRQPPLGHRAAGHHLRRDVGAPLIGVHTADAVDGLLEGGAQRGVALGQRPVEVGLRHGEVLGVDAVEPGGDLAYRLGAPDADVLAQRADGGHHRVDVGCGPRQQVGELALGRQRRTAQVDAGEHGAPPGRTWSLRVASGGVSRRRPPYARGMGDLIPLFPLGTPLFPGVVLPLHVFEPRYRRLMRDLHEPAEASDRRFFGVVAIRQGWEVEQVAPAEALYDVGCTARVRTRGRPARRRFRDRHGGGDRFRLLDVVVGDDPPYLQGEIEWLADEEAAEEYAGDTDGLSIPASVTVDVAARPGAELDGGARRRRHPAVRRVRGRRWPRSGAEGDEGEVADCSRRPTTRRRCPGSSRRRRC